MQPIVANAGENDLSDPKTEQPLPQTSTSGSLDRRRRVQIVVDEAEREMVPYVIPEGSITRVCFTSRTWDIMRQNFRIALEVDNVFICDHFLGKESGERLNYELENLKTSGLFERHMRRWRSSHVTYSELFLQEPNSSHIQLDGLALMVKKLSLYYDSSWKNISVQISYFPEGHPSCKIDPEPNKPRRLLKCLYFPNRECEEGVEYGKHHIVTKGNEVTVQAAFDRLVVFWGDISEHRTTETRVEDFLITLWVNR